MEPYPGEKWWWPVDCLKEGCHGYIGPWDPATVGSEMTHIVAGGGPDWEANKDHDPVYKNEFLGFLRGATQELVKARSDARIVLSEIEQQLRE